MVAGRIDAGGLVEALVAIHVPQKCWGAGAKLDTCVCCRETWPCLTLRLVCAATGSAVPEQQMTGCDGMLPAPSGERGAWIICDLDRGHEPTGCVPYNEAFPR